MMRMLKPSVFLLRGDYVITALLDISKSTPQIMQERQYFSIWIKDEIWGLRTSTVGAAHSYISHSHFIFKRTLQSSFALCFFSCFY